MGYKPLTRKIKDAIYLMMAHAKPSIAVPLWSLIVIPAVYMTQIVFLAFATNLPVGLILGFTLIASALVEEVVKTIGIVVLAERGVVKTWREIIGLSFLSALGFLIGEKLLLLVSISMVSEAQVSGALFGAGLLLFVPLAAHFVFVTIVTVMAAKWRVPYWLALGVGTILHFIYNVNVMRGGM